MRLVPACSLAPVLGGQLGVQIYQCFVDDRHAGGRRVTASRAFLPGGEATFAGREGCGALTLRANCTAAQIILDGGHESQQSQGGQQGQPCQLCQPKPRPRARGLRYITEAGLPATALATKEVVLCAGVIGCVEASWLAAVGV